MTPSLTIEQLWNELRTQSESGGQRRVDAFHPLDLYADYELPDRPGIVAVCGTRPGHVRLLRALTIEQGVRVDGRWSLRVALNEPQLLPVFAALCRDIIAYTRVGVSESALAVAIVGRIDRWRTLLERDSAGLGETVLRGLIGELAVLEIAVMSTLTPEAAVAAWTGPLGTPQDFQLPSGTRIEVKTTNRDSGTVHVNGLDQLDAEADPLLLVVVRVEPTGTSAQGAVTAPLMVARFRRKLAEYPDALVMFDAALASLGWHDHPSHDRVALRLLALDEYDVRGDFPRLTRANVPCGVEDADYCVVLPRQCRTLWRGEA